MGFASSLDIGISSPYAEYSRMMSGLFLTVWLATELLEGGAEQRGRPEA